jgi:hypothetical protein
MHNTLKRAWTVTFSEFLRKIPLAEQSQNEPGVLYAWIVFFSMAEVDVWVRLEGQEDIKKKKVRVPSGSDFKKLLRRVKKLLRKKG